MKKVLVIGSNSFSGSDLIDLILSEREYKVIGISRSPEKSQLFLPYKKNENISRYCFYQLDLNTDMAEIKELFSTEKPEYVVNFAAQSEVAPSWDHPEQWFTTNAAAVAELCNFLRKQTWLDRYLHISSPEVYGTCEGIVTEGAPLNPSTPYAASKASGDLMVYTLYKQFQFPVTLVRATNVYGAHQQLFKIIPRTVIYLLKGDIIQLHGGGKAVKSYIHIRDVSNGELAVLEKGKIGNIYHLSPESGISIKRVVNMICRIMGKSFDAHTENIDERPGQDKTYIIDSSKARLSFSWSPVIEFEKGLHGVIRWIEQNWNRIINESLEYNHRS